jgi:hypothetical protein
MGIWLVGLLAKVPQITASGSGPEDIILVGFQLYLRKRGLKPRRWDFEPYVGELCI